VSSEFSLGLRALFDRVDLSWLQNLTADEIDKVLLSFRDIFVTASAERVSRELREISHRLANGGIPCPVCHKPMTVNRDDNHGWETSVGPMDLYRAYLECREDKVRFFPLDARLRLPSVGRVLPSWGNALSQLGVELPYERGQRLLAALTTRTTSAKTIDAQVQRDGKTLHEIELEEARLLWPYDEKGFPRVVDPATVQAVVARAIFRGPKAGRGLVMQGDGAMINLAADEEIKKERETEAEKALKKRRTKGGQANSGSGEEEPDLDQDQLGSPFRESIQLLIYRLDDVVRKHRGKFGKRKRNKKGQHRRDRTIITQKQTACVVNNPPLVGMQMNRLAYLWGFQNYSVRIFVADGGPKLWELAKEYYQFTVGILDINHARSHIRECGKELYSNDPKKAKKWGHTWATRILKEGPLPLLAELNELAKQKWEGEPARLLTNLIAYVVEHQDHMKYPEFLVKRYPIASGAIEGANKHILISRCRRAGQQFKKDNAQHLLTLRTALLDNRWDKAMEHVRQRQAYPKSPLPPETTTTAENRKVSTEQPRQETSKTLHLPKSPIKPLTETHGPSANSRLDRIIPWRKQVQFRMAGLGHLIDGGPPKRTEVVQP
jgi:hypothetical protein